MRTNERGEHLSAADLAERIAHYAKVRLCDKVDGGVGYTDYLLAEHDRYLICRALRSFQDAASMIKKRRKTDPEILYQWHPNGYEKCEQCAMFRPSAECSAVQGMIDRKGWCRIFESKNALGVRK